MPYILSYCLRVFGRKTVFGVITFCLILGQFSSVQAAPSCQQIFKSPPTLEQLTDQFLSFDGQIDHGLWKRHLDGIQTPAEYLQFLKMVREIMPVSFPSKYKYDDPSLGEDAVVHFLSLTDFVSPIIAVRDRLTAQQVSSLAKEFLALRSEVQTTNTPRQKDWDFLLQSFQMALEPKLVTKYLESIPRDIQVVFNQNSFLQDSSAQALVSLPEADRIQANAILKKKLIKAFREETVTSTDENPNPKTYRRNVEAIHRLIHQKELADLMTTLRQDPKVSVIKEIDAYWAKVYAPCWREKYSFFKVLEIARVIQASPMMKTVPGASVDIYGSFANGKAVLKSSDIDIHPGKELMKEYLEMMTDRIRDYSKPFAQERFGEMRRTETEIREFSRVLVESERMIAQKLGRKNYLPSELMTIVPSHTNSNFFIPAVINHYNPISVRITEASIEVLIHDVMSGKTLSISLK